MKRIFFNDVASTTNFLKATMASIFFGDRMMGTIRKDYDEKFDEVKNRA